MGREQVDGLRSVEVTIVVILRIRLTLVLLIPLRRKSVLNTKLLLR